MDTKEPTLEQVKKDLLEFAGWRQTKIYGLERDFSRWIKPDGKANFGKTDPISSKWLEDWCYPKLGEPIIKTEPWLNGQFLAKLYSHNVVTRATGSTRSEATARATWKAIKQESSGP